MIFCCADTKGYIDGTVSGVQDLGELGAVEDRIINILNKKAESLKSVSRDEMSPRIAVNVALQEIIIE